ncbi:MAG: hypothetical protein F4Y60_02350 [Boseongicola sp. SB0664_bin_43]|uniref:Uncharacterized protein n=1 Tax=Boseongicola sp. SB0664_bin_43 TaxID=2604844 RepID=A0A6B0XYQ0_9RHOB|nr:hypothetical protein [Boseongicola sp. SB0664_bin_43]
MPRAPERELAPRHAFESRIARSMVEPGYDPFSAIQATPASEVARMIKLHYPARGHGKVRNA